MGFYNDYAENVNSLNLNFQTKRTQRFDPQKPFSPLIQGRSFIENQAYMDLLLSFNSRSTLLVSKGKDRAGKFAPLEYLTQNHLRKNWVLQYTHIKLSFEFISKKSKKKIVGFPVLVIDIDEFDGDLGKFARYGLQPNYLILNPQKTTSLQVGYVLSSPVFKASMLHFEDYCLYDARNNALPIEKQSKTFQFYELSKGLTELFGGDTNYKLHIAKNPFAATEVGAVCWDNPNTYSIDELVSIYVNLIKEEDREKDSIFNIDYDDIKNHIEEETIKNPHYQKDENSRNCQLFDDLRITAYEVADLYDKNTSPQFYQYLLDIANSKNQQFERPLPQKEVVATVRSIVKFCLQNKVQCKYPSYQQRRLLKMSQIKNYMLNTYGANYKYKKDERIKLSEKFGISEKTVTTYASQIRKEHGTLQDEKNQLLQEIQALRSAIPPVKWNRIAEILDLSVDNVKKIYQRANVGTKNKTA